MRSNFDTIAAILNMNKQCGFNRKVIFNEFIFNHGSHRIETGFRQIDTIECEISELTRARQNNLARISLFSQIGKRDFFPRFSVQNLSWRKEILKSLLVKSLFGGEKKFKKYYLRFPKEIIVLKISSRKLKRDFSRRDILWKISFHFGEKRFLKYYLGTVFCGEISLSRETQWANSVFRHVIKISRRK